MAFQAAAIPDRPFEPTVVSDGRRLLALPGVIAVVGALVGSVFVIASRSIVDSASALIAIASILALIYVKKLQEPYIILISAIIGYCLKTYL